jgi:hypothetical protein
MLMTDASIPCPSCGFKTFAGEYGSFDMCPICDWHDCAVQLANPLDSNGPNRRSLVECQARALARWPPETTHVQECERDAKWRPLSNAEIGYYRKATDNGNTLVFQAIREPADCYWSRLADPSE